MGRALKNFIFTYCNDSHIKYAQYLIKSIENNTTNIDKVVFCYLGKTPPHYLNSDFVVVEHIQVENSHRNNVNLDFMENFYDILKKHPCDNVIVCDADIYFRSNFEIPDYYDMFYSSYYPSYKGNLNEDIKNGFIIDKVKKILKTFKSQLYMEDRFKMAETFNGKNLNGGFFGGKYEKVLERFLKIKNFIVENKQVSDLGFSADEVLLIKFFDYENDLLLDYETITMGLDNISKDCKVLHVCDKEIYEKQG